MSFSINFERNSRTTKEGLRAIMLRVTINRELWRIMTGVEIKDSDWNAVKQEVRRTNPNHTILNEKLQLRRKEIDSLYHELEKKHATATLSMLCSAYEREHVECTFDEFLCQHIDLLKSRGSLNTCKSYNVFLVKFREFAKKRHKGTVKIADITVELVKEYESYLRTLSNQRDSTKKLHPNTVHGQMKMFKAIVNDMVREGLIEVNDNPFIRYEMPPVIKTTKEQLTPLEIKAIENAIIPKTSKLWHIRNIFLFSYYNAGIRIEDIFLLRMKNITYVNGEYRLQYLMRKVQKPYNSKQAIKAIEIINQYWSEEKNKDDFLFPFLSQYNSIVKFDSVEQLTALPLEQQLHINRKIESQESIVNQGLKEIAKIAKIDKHITFHVSRHSFSRTAHLQGASTDELQVALNHSDPRVTQHYIGELGLNIMDNLTDKVFGESNKTKLIQAIHMCDEKKLTDRLTEKIMSLLC